MKTTRLLVLLVAVLLIVTGCKSRPERARKLLDKAVALDPTILTHTNAKIDTIIDYRDTLKVPGDVQLVEVPCDTSALDALLFENNRLKVELVGVTKVNGKLKKQIKVTEKDQKVPFQVKIPFKVNVPVVVPAQTVVVIDRGFLYYTGVTTWIVIIALVLWYLLGAAVGSRLGRFISIFKKPN